MSRIGWTLAGWVTGIISLILWSRYRNAVDFYEAHRRAWCAVEAMDHEAERLIESVDWETEEW